MARLRPTEVRLVANLLQSEADDAEALAGLIIEGLDAARADRPGYVAVARHLMGGAPIYVASGPHATARQAEKDLGRAVSPGPDMGRGVVVRLKSTLE